MCRATSRASCTCSRAAGPAACEHLVYASTSSVYGANTRMPFSETQNVDHPLTLYAATKKANELMAHSYSSLYGLPTTGLRFFTVYGPWGRPDMALFLFTKNILAGMPIDVFNEGHHQRDFTYVDDIVAGRARRGRSRRGTRIPRWNSDAPDPGTSYAPYRIYNIGNQRPVTLLRYIEVLEKCLGRKAQKNLLPMQPGDVPRHLGGRGMRWRATWATGPATELEEGVQALRRLVSRVLPCPRKRGARSKIDADPTHEAHRMTQLHSSLPAWAAVARPRARELGGAHLRDLAAADPEALAGSAPRARRLAARFLAPAHHARDARAADRARARGGPARRASRRCSAAIRSTPPNAARCCTRRCARTSPAPPRSRPRCAIRAQQARRLRRRGAPRRRARRRPARSSSTWSTSGSAARISARCWCANALRHEWSGGITPHFVSNVDRTQLDDLTRTLDPAETLVIVCSKTFTTQETQVECECGARLDRGGAGGRGAGATISSPCRPTPRRWTRSASRRRIASRCGIGWAAATRSGPRSDWSRNSPSAATNSVSF